jgi:hypothetical protein
VRGESRQQTAESRNGKRVQGSGFRYYLGEEISNLGSS